MATIGKSIKKYLYSKSAPDFLFGLYFNRLTSKNRRQLKHILQNGLGLTDHLKDQVKAYWKERIQNVLDSPDNDSIPKVDNAGQITQGTLIMHNGIQIDPLSYYNFPILQMLMENKGVHEPQEEKIFQEVLKSLDANNRMTMLELGSYWSFYSMWFKKVFSGSNCIMVEPDRRNLFYGKQNFKLNKMSGTFIHAGIGKEQNIKNNITTVDLICKEQQVDFIDILHCDIQGYELEMLSGAKEMFVSKRIGYVFISTHSNELHYDCYKVLREDYDFTLVAGADMDESFSWDGVLVMKAPHYDGVEEVTIAKKEMKK